MCLARRLRAATAFRHGAIHGFEAHAAEDSIPETARTVMALTFANLYGFSSIQRVEIRARDPGAREFLRTAPIVRRGTDEGLNRMLVRPLGLGDIPVPVEHFLRRDGEDPDSRKPTAEAFAPCSDARRS